MIVRRHCLDVGIDEDQRQIQCVARAHVAFYMREWVSACVFDAIAFPPNGSLSLSLSVSLRTLSILLTLLIFSSPHPSLQDYLCLFSLIIRSLFICSPAAIAYMHRKRNYESKKRKKKSNCILENTKIIISNWFKVE